MPNRLFFLLLFFAASLWGQKRFVLREDGSHKSVIRNDSAAAARFLDSLVEAGFYEVAVLKTQPHKEGLEILYRRGRDHREAHITVSDSLAKIFRTAPEFRTRNADSLRQKWSQELAARGYSFARIKTEYQGKDHEVPRLRLSVVPGRQRTVDRLVIKDYDKIPRRFVRNLEREALAKPYTNPLLIQLQQSLQNHPYVTLSRPPQTLFTKDSTQVFLFMQKRKVNVFDAMVGFGNDKEEKISFSGTVNVQLRNVFNSFESLGLYWQRSPEKAQTFTAGLTFPYLFGSNVGTETTVNIFRQDTLFSNIRFEPGLFYNLGLRQKLGVKGTLELSSSTQKQTETLQNYSKKGIGLFYDWLQPAAEEILGANTLLHAEAGYLQNLYDDNTTAKQYRLYGRGEKNLRLRGPHYLNLRAEGGWLKSDLTLTQNELFRIGGWNSLRGFNENSILAERYGYGTLEYRYLINGQSFFDVFGQYGGLHNGALGVSPTFYSAGVGFQMYLPIGLMSFQISGGTFVGQPLKFADTKIHWGIITRF